jgi:hypothetical protein
VLVSLGVFTGLEVLIVITADQNVFEIVRTSPHLAHLNLKVRMSRI